MKTVCFLCKGSFRRKYKLASMHNMNSAKEIVDTMNQSQLYNHKWHYFLTDEKGEEIYPTTAKQRLESLKRIEEEIWKASKNVGTQDPNEING